MSVQNNVNANFVDLMMDSTDPIDHARALRLATVQNQYSIGNLSLEYAQILLQGPVVPNDPLTIHNDSEYLLKGVVIEFVE